MNIESKPAERALDAIVALKAKSLEKEGSADGGVDLVAIVKKLARNRSRSKRAAKSS